MNYNDLKSKQKKEISIGIEHGLSNEQIEKFAKRKYRVNPYVGNQMAPVRKMVEKGFADDIINLIANPDFDGAEIDALQVIFEGTVTKKEMELYRSYPYNARQLKEIRLAFRRNLPNQAIRMISDPKYDSGQMQQIRLAWENGVSEGGINLLADANLSWRQMEWILKGLLEFPMDYVEAYASTEFSDDQMEQIYTGFHQELPPEKVKAYADPALAWKKMREARLLLIERQPFEDDLSVLKKNGVEYNDFSIDQRHEIRKGFLFGLTPEEVLEYCDPSLTAEEHDEESFKYAGKLIWFSDTDDGEYDINDPEDIDDDEMDDSEMGTIRRRLMFSHLK